MKRCSKCGEEKDLSKFHKDKHAKFGVRSNCKVCNNKRKKEYYQQNRERAIKKQIEYNKEYRKNNREAILEKQKEYYKNNREKRLEYTKEYNRNNKEKKREYYKEYQKEKCQNDPLFKMIRNYRRRTRAAYHNASTTKTKGIMELLGCTGRELKEHLEKQFQPGMTHDNYGEWHIDHIRPIASFDLSDPKQEQECFHYTNLQPLWAEDNLRKGDKWT